MRTTEMIRNEAKALNEVIQGTHDLAVRFPCNDPRYHYYMAMYHLKCGEYQELMNELQTVAGIGLS